MNPVNSEGWLTRAGRQGAHSLGLDHAVAYTVGARICNIIGSAGTVLLIVHLLSPVEQGYYYTLFSLVNLQIVFELGFSFVVQQFAAHESVHLILHSDGRIEGDETAHARLALVLRKAVKWYAVAALLMGGTLLLIGVAFFSGHHEAGEAVAWRGPLLVSVLASMLVFALDPLLSFLDGCGQVRQVAAARLTQSAMAIVAAWTSFLSHHGLYSPAMVILGGVVIGSGFVWTRRKLLLGLLRYPAPAGAISWREEIWSFQWKIAISWLCSYFAVQIFTPALFLFRGATDAGRMGMSLSIVSYMWNIVLAWMSTKATPFGQMIARGDYDKLDRIFFRTMRQSLGVLAALTVACMGCVLALPHVYPHLADRMITPAGFALMLPTAMGAYVMQSEAIYLRAHKYEPFLVLSIVVAFFTIAGAYLLTPRWGVMGAAGTYLISTGLIGAFSATAIFLRRRKFDRSVQMRAAAVIEA